jgi:hypothetical protein
MKHRTANGLLGLFSATTLGLAAATTAEFPVVPTLPTPAKPDGKEADMCKPAHMFKIDWMSIGGKFGPEYGIGHYVGETVEAPVITLKSCIGKRSLGFDLLPTGAEPYEFQGQVIPGYRGAAANPKGNGPKPEGWYPGKQYDDDIAYAKDVRSNLGEYYPE